MPRTCLSFPFAIANGTLALSSDGDRDNQDVVATLFTRQPERILRPYTAGTIDFTFSSVTAPSAIAKKMAIAIEEQCPTIAKCVGLGRIGDNGTMIVQLVYAPKLDPSSNQTLTLSVTS